MFIDKAKMHSISARWVTKKSGGNMSPSFSQSLSLLNANEVEHHENVNKISSEPLWLLAIDFVAPELLKT